MVVPLALHASPRAPLHSQRTAASEVWQALRRKERRVACFLPANTATPLALLLWTSLCHAISARMNSGNLCLGQLLRLLPGVALKHGVRIAC